MGAKVLSLDMITRLDMPAEKVLNGAVSAGLDCVVVVGVTKDGDEYFASSLADGGDVLWHLERAKLKLLRIAD